MPETPKSSLVEEEIEIMISEKNKKALEFIEDVTREADQVQKQVLAEILTRNAHVEYLKRFGLDGRADSESFKRLLPVVSYEDLQPYMDRIAHGDKSPILCSDPITEFLTSSGTSGGEMKLMPMIEEEMERRSHLYSLLMPVMNQFIPGLDKGKGMYFLFVRAEVTTPGGVLTRPVLTSFYKSRHFKNRAYDPFNSYTSPDDTILCPDSYQSMYSQLLCGLLQHKDVLRMGAVFASGFIRAIKFLEKNWPSLCKDIRTGILDTQITDPSVIQAVMKLLKPNPELADFVEKECGRETWEGIITRLWPNTKYIDVTVTGTMTQYINTLDYYSKGLPLVCTFYGSSECYFGLNLEPLSKPSEVSYTLIPTMGYFEFLPLHTDSDSVSVAGSVNEKEQQELVDLVDVKLGQEYEIVVTTYAGLYRYKVGDILRVSGFKNKAPTFNFVSRKNVVLSIDIDKTDEVELQEAVKNSVCHLHPFEASLLEYTSYVDTSTIPGHYVLYWELREGPTSIPPSVFENCCLTIEESLSGVYRQGRVSEKTIGPLEIKIVETGTFEKLMDYALSRGASISQYKTPISVKFEPIVELLNSRVVANHFSPKFPSWLPGLKQWTG